MKDIVKTNQDKDQRSRWKKASRLKMKTEERGTEGSICLLRESKFFKINSAKKGKKIVKKRFIIPKAALILYGNKFYS